VATAARSPEAAPIGDGILGVMIVQGGFGGISIARMLEF
jgi:hypothetical protein